MDENLLNLKNLGKTMVLWLNKAGINSTSQLRGLGAAKAYHIVSLRRECRIPHSFLFALEGALTDRHWTELPDTRKQELMHLAQRAGSKEPFKTGKEKVKIPVDL